MITACLAQSITTGPFCQPLPGASFLLAPVALNSFKVHKCSHAKTLKRIDTWLDSFCLTASHTSFLDRALFHSTQRGLHSSGKRRHVLFPQLDLDHWLGFLVPTCGMHTSSTLFLQSQSCEMSCTFVLGISSSLLLSASEGDLRAGLHSSSGFGQVLFAFVVVTACCASAL